MSNMSYCRFENTAVDLSDCLEHIEDDLEGYEFKARKRLISLARRIADYDEDDFTEVKEEEVLK